MSATSWPLLRWRRNTGSGPVADVVGRSRPTTRATGGATDSRGLGGSEQGITLWKVMMMLNKIFGHLCIVVAAVALATAPAVGAEPDPAGALRSLWSIPVDAAGDAIGAGGLIGAVVIAIDADVIALVDDNGLTQPFLRGFASTPLRRMAGALSQSATTAVTGLHTRDTPPESKPTDLRLKHGESHLRTVGRGFGAIGLIAVESLANAGLFVTHAIGANRSAEQLARAQTDVRTAWVGPATDGDTESGAVSLAVEQRN